MSCRLYKHLGFLLALDKPEGSSYLVILLSIEGLGCGSLTVGILVRILI